MSKANADLWRYRVWNTPGGCAAYWIQRAIQPDATQLAKGAARCFWSLALQDIGAEAAHHALYLAGVDLPDWLIDEKPAGALPMKRQRRERGAA